MNAKKKLADLRFWPHFFISLFILFHLPSLNCAESAKAGQRGQSFADYQDLLTKVTEVNFVESQIELCQQEIRRLEQTHERLKNSADFGRFGKDLRLSIYDRQKKIELLKLTREKLDLALEKHEVFRYDKTYGDSADREIFLLIKQLLRVRAQMEATVKDPDLPALWTEQGSSARMNLSALRKKMIDASLELEGLRALIDLARLDKAMMDQLARNKVEIAAAVEKARGLIREGWDSIARLRSLQVEEMLKESRESLSKEAKELSDFYELMDFLTDSGSYGRGKEPLFPAGPAVPPALLENTKAMIVWVEIDKSEYYPEEPVLGTIWVKNGKPPFTLSGGTGFGSGYRPGGIISEHTRLMIAPSLSAGEKQKPCTFVAAVTDADGQAVNSNTTGFMVIARSGKTAELATPSEKAREPAQEPRLAKRGPVSSDFKLFELMGYGVTCDLTKSNLMSINQGGGGVVAVTGRIGDVWFSTADPPVAGYVVLNDAEIRGPGYEIHSYAEGALFFPVVAGTNNYEFQFRVGGKDCAKVITVALDPGNLWLDDIQKTEAAIAENMSRLSQYEQGSYSWNLCWVGIGTGYGRLFFYHDARGDLNKAYEMLKTGTSLSAVEGRVVFFETIADNWQSMRHIACFLDPKEVFGYIDNALNLDYDFIYKRYLNIWQSPQEDLKKHQAAILHKLKAYVYMDRFSDFNSAKKEWDEHNAFRTPEPVPVSWTRKQ